MRYFVFILLLASLFSCDKEMMTPSVDSNSVFIAFEFTNKSADGNLKTLIESKEFRAGLDAIDFFSPQINQASLDPIDGGVVLSSDSSVDTTTGEGENVEGKKILIRLEGDPRIPDGVYIHDTCNGDLINFVGRTIGTVAGIYPQTEDCD